jgi:hypothetical protein
LTIPKGHELGLQARTKVGNVPHSHGIDLHGQSGVLLARTHIVKRRAVDDGVWCLPFEEELQLSPIGHIGIVAQRREAGFAAPSQRLNDISAQLSVRTENDDVHRGGIAHRPA